MGVTVSEHMVKLMLKGMQKNPKIDVY